MVFFRHPHDSTPLLACRRSLRLSLRWLSVGLDTDNNTEYPLDVSAWHSVAAAVASRWSALSPTAEPQPAVLSDCSLRHRPLPSRLQSRTPRGSALPVTSSLVLLTIVGVEQPQPSEFCVGQRIAAAVQYGATEIDLWALWDSTASNWTQVETAWRP